MDQRVEGRVLLVFPLLAFVEVLLLVRNVLTLPHPAEAILGVLQGMLVVALLAVWLWMRSKPPSMAVLSVVILALLLALSTLILLEQALTGQGLLSANLALLLVVGGALVWPPRHFAAYSAVLVLGWLAVILSRTGWDIPVARQGLLVGLGLLIGWVVSILRDTDRRLLQAARDEAISTAMRDPLTLLWNRRGVLSLLPSLIGGSRHLGAGVWCAFIDVRGLKSVNDTLGHAAGDQLLTAIGGVLLAQEDRGCVPARWGGDEFCLFGAGPAPDPAALAAELLVDLHALVDMPAIWDLSCGTAYDDLSGLTDVDALVSAADQDMYRRRGQEGR